MRVRWVTRLAVIGFAVSMLTACAGFRSPAEWPPTLPGQAIFLHAYGADPANQRLQSQGEYLDWVRRFYEGSFTMPLGWNDLTPAVLYGLDTDQHRLASRKRNELGVLISAEWAKDNSIRVIDTEMLSLWGAILEAESDPELRIAAMDLIISDVRAILDERLAPRAITEARYQDRLGISLQDEWAF